MKFSVTQMLITVALIASGASLSAGTHSEFDIRVGASYKESKAMLISKGWMIVNGNDSSALVPFKKYPEISCGTGRHAICSVGFSKGSKSIAVTIEKRNETFVITGEY